MLNPLVVWEPGVLVRYHGSLAELHGEYRAYLCTCRRCDDPIIGSVRFKLLDQAGTLAVSCVRARSITPADDDGTDDYIGPHCNSPGEN